MGLTKSMIKIILLARTLAQNHPPQFCLLQRAVIFTSPLQGSLNINTSLGVKIKVLNMVREQPKKAQSRHVEAETSWKPGRKMLK
jgi:hypothetical protein